MSRLLNAGELKIDAVIFLGGRGIFESRPYSLIENNH